MTPIAMLISGLRRRTPEADSAPALAAEPPRSLSPHGRRRAICAYAAQGLSRDEIVRRTRFAYDAVALLVPAGTEDGAGELA